MTMMNPSKLNDVRWNVKRKRPTAMKRTTTI
jgi:hypothetical protein